MEGDLSRLSGMLVPLLGLLLAAYIWKKPLEGQDEFYSRQNWSLQLAVCFFISEVAIEIVDAQLIGSSPSLGAWLGSHFFSLVWILLFFRYVRQPLSVVGLERKNGWSHLSRGVIWALALLCVSWLLLSIGGKNLATDALEGRVFAGYVAMYAKSPGWATFFYWLLSLWMAFFVGVTEELQFRGILYGALRKHIYAAAAIAISAVCFTASHGQFNPLHLLFGWLTASLTEKHRSLIPAIVIHVSWNLCRNIDTWFVGILQIMPKTYFFMAIVTGLVLMAAVYVASRWHDLRTEAESN